MKLRLRRLFLRWTRRSRAIRELARELKIKEVLAFEIVAAVEADSVNIARQRTIKSRTIQEFAATVGIAEAPVFELVTSIEADSLKIARQLVMEAKRKANEEWRSIRDYSSDTRPDRPSNRSTSGARLSSY